MKKESDQKLKELRERQKQELEALSKEFEDKGGNERELATQEMQIQLKQLRDLDKAVLDKEKIKFENLLKDERDASRKFRESKETEILQLREDLEREFEEQTRNHQNSEQALQASIQQKEKALKQLKLDSQKSYIEKEQLHRQKLSQIEEEYMIQIEQIKEEFEQQKKEKDLTLLTQTKELGNMTALNLRQQEVLQKTIASLELQVSDLTEKLSYQEQQVMELQGDETSKNQMKQQQLEKLKAQTKKD